MVAADEMQADRAAGARFDEGVLAALEPGMRLGGCRITG
jgi:hypothetical protein